MKCDTERFLHWLGQMIQQAQAVDVDVIVLDEATSISSVQIVLRDIPLDLAGLEIRPSDDGSVGDLFHR